MNVNLVERRLICNISGKYRENIMSNSLDLYGQIIYQLLKIMVLNFLMVFKMIIKKKNFIKIIQDILNKKELKEITIMFIRNKIQKVL